MFSHLLSGDFPRSRVLLVVLLLILAGLTFAPFAFPGAKALNVAAKICIFIVLVASFDLLLGYTGIVSFAHTMFFGIGAYGIAMAITRLGPTWKAIAVGTAAALIASLALSLLIGLFSLRVKALFYAMITLAVATAFQTLASQLSDFTGGEDGLSFRVPEVLTPGFSLSGHPFQGAVGEDGPDLLWILDPERHRRGGEDLAQEPGDLPEEGPLLWGHHPMLPFQDRARGRHPVAERSIRLPGQRRVTISSTLKTVQPLLR